jgi:hypothetical protein
MLFNMTSLFCFQETGRAASLSPLAMLLERGQAGHYDIFKKLSWPAAGFGSAPAVPPEVDREKARERRQEQPRQQRTWRKACLFKHVSDIRPPPRPARPSGVN